MSIPTFILLFLILLFSGLPVAFAMGISSFVYFILSGNLLNLMMIPERIFEGINVFVLMAIPFFMLAGEIMNKSGISGKLIDFSNLIIGRVRGGLAQVNVLASILFAGITGVALGDIAALGSVFIPNMERQGYDRKFSAAVTAASSIVGPIIPPSTIIVIYAAIMEVSVGAMFAGAIIPGILIGISDMIIVHYLSTKRKYPKVEVKINYKAFMHSLKDAILALIMPVIIIGGILFGVFTPTEAAASSVFYALIVGFCVFRSLKIMDLVEIINNSITLSAKLFFIVGGASIINWVFGIENIPTYVHNFFTDLTTNKYALILAINLFYLFAGMWVSAAVTIILFAPVLGPLAVELGIHPIQFGIMLIVNANIGYISPPVGNVLFATADIARLNIIELGKELIPFLLINFVVILLVGYIPFLTLYLPKFLGFID
jgi:tripartite ATP-independent transporter DctM subunit